MTGRTRPPFRADIVGSFLRPERLKRAREQAGLALGSTAERPQGGAISPDELRRVEDDCIRELVAFEEEVGLKAVTDGEFRRGSWAYDFIGWMEGIELRRQDGSYDASFSTTGFRPPIAHATDVDIDNLALGPQCGFASVARGNPITFHDQRRKLELIIAVADEVWGGL